jgi:hypothetical protein
MALQYAESRGWSIVPKKRGHAWGTATCPGACAPRSIWSTPRSAGGHARALFRLVDACAHSSEPS